jgi:hypothetical protein
LTIPINRAERTFVKIPIAKDVPVIYLFLLSLPPVEEKLTIKRTPKKLAAIFQTSNFFSFSLRKINARIRVKKGYKFCIVYDNPTGITPAE